MKIKMKNEKMLKANIKEKLDELNHCLAELKKVKDEIKKCREAIGEADDELLAISRSKYIPVEDGAGCAIDAADKRTSNKAQLEDVIKKNQHRIELLGATESKIDIQLLGLKEPIQQSREAYCKAFENALKATPEFKALEKEIGTLKALWLEAFNGHLYCEDIVSDLGLHDVPVEHLREKARAELLIK